MTIAGWTLIVLFIALIAALAKPAGLLLYRLHDGRALPLEGGLYRIAGAGPREQSWVAYAAAVVTFNVAGIVLLFAILKLQGGLPLNPQGFDGMESWLAFNTAVSFVTNTNWQNYGGETTLSHFSQMAGLTVQNFVSAATGIAVAFAFIRAFARSSVATLGNFWVDMTRVTLYLLLPACVVLTIAYVAMGVPQTLAASVTATTVEGAEQVIALGPVASQLAIKMLGTNGGGFFNVNSAHPFENPTALANFLQMLTIFVLGAGLTLTFGKAVGNLRQGWTILTAMLVLFLVGVTVTYWAEAAGNPIHQALGLAGGNMEGKDVRLGIAATALFAVVTTAASCGAVNGMHGSLMPLAGLVTLFNMQLGEVIVGGVGAGFYGILIYAILAVFIAGLMVGRTPEYIGKKIEAREMKLAVISIAILPLCILGLTALASVTAAGLAGPLAKGPHGFSEILYAYSSAVANNGSAFGSLTGNTPFYNITLAIGMFVGRFGVIIPALAIAGGLAAKRRLPEGPGSFPTTGGLWVGLLAAVILIVGGLTFLPSLALGPIADQFHVGAGTPSLKDTDMSTQTTLFTGPIVSAAARDALVKLNPATLIRNPVMFVTAIVAALSTILWVRALLTGSGSAAFEGQLVFWLWLTVLFGNFAEAIAEGRGKAQAASLRATKADLRAKLLDGRVVDASTLKIGDVVRIDTGEVIPADGEVVAGVAFVNEAAITGESAPVIREGGGDRSAVTAGTRVIADWIEVRVTAGAGQGFLDRMIALVEGASRQKTPNEIALTILLAGLTLIFLIAVGTLPAFASYAQGSIAVPVLVALFVTLIPTTISGLLSAIGIAGMDRLVRFNVLAKSGRAVEAAGDIDTLLLDKTGTITIGDRQAVAFLPLPDIADSALIAAARLASLADETPEGRSIVLLADEQAPGGEALPVGAAPIAFTSQTRVSGLQIGERALVKGAVDAVLKRLPAAAGADALKRIADDIARTGGTPLAVADGERLLGVVHLKDIVKAGIRERFGELRRMGIKTVMITGDNPLTAASIAAESGVDDFLAEATPEDKLAYIRREQEGGKLVAMCGDGTNDAPALAQSDVGVAMNTGTQAAREAGNMVDLDSDPTKLIEIVGLGKQLLMTRGALTTFSISNDVAKYFAILPAIFVTLYPGLGALNVMGLGSPESAILSAIIFNAIIIPLLVPLALKGVKYRAVDAGSLLARNLAIYGVGGLIAPFVGIKLIDIAVTGLNLA